MCVTESLVVFSQTKLGSRYSPLQQNEFPHLSRSSGRLRARTAANCSFEPRRFQSGFNFWTLPSLAVGRGIARFRKTWLKTPTEMLQHNALQHFCWLHYACVLTQREPAPHPRGWSGRSLAARRAQALRCPSAKARYQRRRSDGRALCQGPSSRQLGQCLSSQTVVHFSVQIVKRRVNVYTCSIEVVNFFDTYRLAWSACGTSQPAKPQAKSQAAHQQ
jgi:hypothetical protein